MSRSLHDVLQVARDRGFLGPGDVAFHVEHSRRFLGALRSEDERLLDLGSGAGVPGLVIAVLRPTSFVVLLESGARRCDFLRASVEELGLAGHVEVEHRRAEEAGRDERLRGAFDVVVSRSFGPPAVVAECAAPLLRPGGRLVVSEPRGASRWSDDALGELGLRPESVLEDEVARLQVLEQRRRCPDRYPRRVGVPAKRPLF